MRVYGYTLPRPWESRFSSVEGGKQSERLSSTVIAIHASEVHAQLKTRTLYMQESHGHHQKRFIASLVSPQRSSLLAQALPHRLTGSLGAKLRPASGSRPVRSRSRRRRSLPGRLEVFF